MAKGTNGMAFSNGKQSEGTSFSDAAWLAAKV